MFMINFSLPEGCDLALDLDRARAMICITYQNSHLMVLADTILGTEFSLRKRVRGLGVSLTSTFGGESEEVRVSDVNRAISRRIAERERYREKDRLQLNEELENSLRHLASNMSADSYERVRAEAYRALERTEAVQARRPRGLRYSEYASIGSSTTQAVLRAPHMQALEMNFFTAEMAAYSDTVNQDQQSFGGIPIVEDPQMPPETIGVAQTGVFVANGREYIVRSNGATYRLPNNEMINITTVAE